MGQITNGQANRHAKTKAARAARRAKDIVGINHKKHAEKAKKIAAFYKTNPIDPPHGAARKARRALVNWAQVNERRHNEGRANVRWQEFIGK